MHNYIISVAHSIFVLIYALLTVKLLQFNINEIVFVTNIHFTNATMFLNVNKTLLHCHSIALMLYSNIKYKLQCNKVEPCLIMAIATDGSYLKLNNVTM